MKLRTTIQALFACLALASFACASPIGSLTVGQCTPGGVTVNATTIDWYNPVGPPDGCIVTQGGTSVTYTGGTLTDSVFGSILDLTFGGGAVANFMTFSGNPLLHFDLDSLGPGSANTTCAGLAVGQSCSAFAGSPIILTRTSNGTGVLLTANGMAGDGSGTSAWTGTFTTQIIGKSPSQIQATIAGGGSVSSSYSGAFAVNLVPEPISLSLVGAGLIALGFKKRGKKTA